MRFFYFYEPMANQSYFFDHDYSARNDDKILEMRSVYKAEGYGIFWMILETMAENENGGVNTSLIGGLSLGYGVAKGWLSEFIKFCISIGLFVEKEGFIYSNRMLSHKELMSSYADFGRQGAEKRWGGHRGANRGPNAKRIDKKEKNRGKEFSPDNTEVIFHDGRKQKLGPGQLADLQNNNLSPRSVFWGSEY